MRTILGTLLIIVLVGCQKSTPTPLVDPPKPVGLVQEAADAWRDGVKRVFTETAAWCATDESITDVQANDHLRAEMAAMTKEVTTPLMVALNGSVITDEQGNPSWNREKFVEILNNLGGE